MLKDGRRKFHQPTFLPNTVYPLFPKICWAHPLGLSFISSPPSSDDSSLLLLLVNTSLLALPFLCISRLIPGVDKTKQNKASPFLLIYVKKKKNKKPVLRYGAKLVERSCQNPRRSVLWDFHFWVSGDSSSPWPYRVWSEDLKLGHDPRASQKCRISGLLPYLQDNGGVSSFHPHKSRVKRK